MTAQIRPAVQADCPALCEIANRLITETTVQFSQTLKTAADFEGLLNGPFPFYVAQVDDLPVGYITVGPFRSGTGYLKAAEHSIALADTAKGMGLGRRLIEAAIPDLKEIGIGVLMAVVSGENPAGVAFHKAAGFEQTAIIPRVGYKFDRWLDIVILQRWL